MGQPANDWSVGLVCRTRVISQSLPSLQTTLMGCLKLRFGEGKKRYLPASTTPRSKWPSSFVKMARYKTNLSFSFAVFKIIFEFTNGAPLESLNSPNTCIFSLSSKFERMISSPHEVCSG